MWPWSRSKEKAEEAADQRWRWVVAGLGNPGRRYEDTPHNLGFMVIDRLGERNGIRISRKECQALTGGGRLSEEPVLLAKPQTFMNVSGPSVKSLLVKHQVGVSGLVLVYDELSLPWMSLRIRATGSAGGHNGVTSVIQALGTMDFTRVRLGIHPGHPISDGAKFVLSPLRRGQKKELDELLDEASAAVESIVAEGVEKAMTKYNRRAPSQEKE